MPDDPADIKYWDNTKRP